MPALQVSLKVPSSMIHGVRVAALSDVGCTRKNNEDAFGYDEAAQVYVVSDGMGGSAAGEIASQTAVTEAVQSFSRMRSISQSAAMPAQDLLYHAVRRANAVVHALGARNPEWTGLGATMVAASIQGSVAVVANVGDSRAYLLRKGECLQITEDHSHVAEQVRLGLLSPERAATHPQSTVITRAIGVQPEVEPDVFAAELVAGDRLLLATDGLMRHVTDAEIAMLGGRCPDLETACVGLVELAKQRGAKDNVTCLLIEFS